MGSTYALTNEELIERIRGGDESARGELVTSNMKLVYNLCQRFTGRGAELEDLHQIGAMGLMRAARDFDASYGVKFSTYAVPLIMGEIKRYLRDNSIIKSSRSLKELATKVRHASSQLLAKLGREPTISEIADELEVSREDIVMALEATAAPQSLNAPVGGDDTTSLESFIAVSAHEDALLDNLALNATLSHLSNREKKLIILRYFKELTQTQTAKILGISQVSVSRLEKKTLLKLREQLRDE